MNYNDLLRMCLLRQNANPTWRTGQTIFNTIQEFRPEKAEEIRGTDLDPFYAEGGNVEFWARFHTWLASWCDMTGAI
jgi:hypothetical protein